MTYKEIQDLIKLVGKTELSEFKMKNGDFELSIRTKEFTKSKGGNGATNFVSIPQATAIPPIPNISSPVAVNTPVSGGEVEPKKEEAAKNNLIEVKSPIVGTFYRSSSPDKPPYLKIGDQVEVGDVVCIVEAMKLFNEIESEVSGKVVKVMVEDASPVQYDQVLFLVEPA